MSSAYVTFKLDKQNGSVSVLRDPTPAKELRRGGAEFAWAAKTGSGGGPPPAPQSSVFFKVVAVFAGTIIHRLEAIPEREFEQIKASQKVARFEPWKEFEYAAREALGLS